MASPLMALNIKVTTSITTSGTSVDVAIPVMFDGVTVGKTIRLAATAACWVKHGVGAQTAVAGSAGFLIQPGDSIVLNIAGDTHIAAIQDSAAGKLSIGVVENYV